MYVHTVEKELEEALAAGLEKDQQVKSAIRAADDAKFELTKGQKEVNDMKKKLKEQMDSFQGELDDANRQNDELHQRISELQKSNVESGTRLLERTHDQIEAEEADKRRILMVWYL